MGAFGHEFAARDRQATVNFGEAARVAGTERIVYLGGLEAVRSRAWRRRRADLP
jgi:hypothetical protein